MQLSEAKLYFFYDSNGYLTRIYHNGTNYYTATNLKGDVVAIYRHTGALWSTYEYDAWGNVISVKDANGADITSQTHVANANPIRYRGYYYDTETELYYLQSRYYNPDIGRFLNADGYLTTGQGVLSYNMFAYCGNNPVMYSDPSGCFFEELGNKIRDFFINTFFGLTTLSKSDVIKTAGNVGSKTFGVLGVANTMISFNKEVNVEPKQELTQYAKDIQNLNYAKTHNQSYEVQSPNVKIFGSDETYRKLCENNYNTYQQTCEGLFIDISNKRWEDLDDTNKEIISSFMLTWDPTSNAKMKITHATDGANSF